MTVAVCGDPGTVVDAAGSGTSASRLNIAPNPSAGVRVGTVRYQDRVFAVVQSGTTKPVLKTETV